METYYLWQHLSNIGLIDQRYTGGCATANSCATDGAYTEAVGASSPKAPVNSAAINENLFGAKFANRHPLTVGKYVNSALGHEAETGAFTIAQVYTLDNKADNGIASQGKIRNVTHYAVIGGGLRTPGFFFHSIYCCHGRA